MAVVVRRRGTATCGGSAVSGIRTRFWWLIFSGSAATYFPWKLANHRDADGEMLITLDAKHEEWIFQE